MRIKITNEVSQVAGYVTWERLATQVLRNACEIRSDEHITHFDVSECGINYFVSRTASEKERK